MEFDSSLVLILKPLKLFVVVVLPMWITFHYITVWKRERRQGRVDRSSHKELRAQAERLEERLDAIESILDTDAPDWRSRS